MSRAQRILFFIVMIFPLWSNAQTKVSLNLTNVHFEEVIKDIERQTFYSFVYSESKLPKQPMSIKVVQLETTKVLE